MILVFKRQGSYIRVKKLSSVGSGQQQYLEGFCAIRTLFRNGVLTVTSAPLFLFQAFFFCVFFAKTDTLFKTIASKTNPELMSRAQVFAFNNCRNFFWKYSNKLAYCRAQVVD